MALATRSSLRADLERIGVTAGDAVFVHAALRKVGPVVGGANTIIDALRDAVGPSGTLLAYADWQGMDDVLGDPAIYNDPASRPQVPPVDPKTSRATRDNCTFPELRHTTPGALRSANPGASCVAARTASSATRSPASRQCRTASQARGLNHWRARNHRLTACHDGSRWRRWAHS